MILSEFKDSKTANFTNCILLTSVLFYTTLFLSACKNNLHISECNTGKSKLKSVVLIYSFLSIIVCCFTCLDVFSRLKPRRHFVMPWRIIILHIANIILKHQIPTHINTLKRYAPRTEDNIVLTTLS